MKISQKKMFLCQLIETLGIVLTVIFGFLTAVSGSWWAFLGFCVGLLAYVVGMLLRDNLYRCPNCGHYLLERGGRYRIIGNRLFEHCPGCGWRVTIEEE